MTQWQLLCQMCPQPFPGLHPPLALGCFGASALPSAASYRRTYPAPPPAQGISLPPRNHLDFSGSNFCPGLQGVMSIAE